MILYSSIIILLSNAVNNRRDSSMLSSRLAIFILIYSSLLIFFNIYIDFFTKGITLYNGLLTYKIFTSIITIVIFIITSIILGIVSFNKHSILNTKFEPIKNYLFHKNFYKTKEILEYPLIILFCITGAILLTCSTDIISMFISIELQSYGLYLICSIYKDSEKSVNAGLTYFLLGGLSSCIILLGQSYIYINTGTTNMENLFIMKNIAESIYYEDLFISYSNLSANFTILNYIQYSLILITVGLFFKIAAAPFHFWAPDVYDAIPTIVTTFVAIIAKISIFVLLLQLLQYTITEHIYTSWIKNILLSSILSLIIGSILGLVQYRIKRLYAYSTISHIGFILLALSINSYESIQAFFFYLIQYSFSNLNAFIILIAIGHSLYLYIWNDKTISYRSIKDFNNSPIQLISQLKGYFYVNPMLSVSFIVTLFSFIGVPPLIGFFAKQMILTTALDNGYVFISLLAILTSVISAVYYLIIIKNIFSEEKIYTKIYINNLSIASSMSIPISIISLLLLSFMFYNIENSLGIIMYLD